MKVKIESVCSVDGCEAVRHNKFYCSKHYQRMMRHGDTSISKITKRAVNKKCAKIGCDEISKGQTHCHAHRDVTSNVNECVRLANKILDNIMMKRGGQWGLNIA